MKLICAFSLAVLFVFAGYKIAFDSPFVEDEALVAEQPILATNKSVAARISEGVALVQVEESVPEVISEIQELGKLSVEELIHRAGDLNQLPLHEQVVTAPILLALLAESDPKAALLAAKRLEHSKAAMVSLIFASWAEKNPLEAADHYKKNEKSLFTKNRWNPNEQVSAASVIVTALANQASPDDAFQWARTLGNVADRNIAVREVYQLAVAQSPSSALAYLEQAPLGEKRFAIEAIAHGWPNEQIDSAIDWINTLNDSEVSIALPKLINGVAKTAPEDAAWLLQYVEGNRDAAISAIVKPLSTENPKKAAEWLVKETSADEYRYFLEPVLADWINQDQASTKAWIESLESGIAKDQATVAYVRATTSGKEEHSQLLSMIRSDIGDEIIREEAIVDVLVAWNRIDPKLSKAYAHKSNLSDNALANFFHAIKANYPLD